MQPHGSPAPSATSPAPSPATATPGAPPTSAASPVAATGPTAATSALASLVAGQGAPPPAILIQGPPPVRLFEIATLIAIVALADLGLNQSGGGVGLAMLFAGVPAILFVASDTR